jgi:hypothetical protein
VYNVFSLCKSVSSAAILFARATKEIFCASSVAVIAVNSQRHWMVDQRELTLWRILNLLSSRGELSFDLLQKL